MDFPPLMKEGYSKAPEGHHPRGTTLREALRGNLPLRRLCGGRGAPPQVKHNQLERELFLFCANFGRRKTFGKVPVRDF